MIMLNDIQYKLDTKNTFMLMKGYLCFTFLYTRQKWSQNSVFKLFSCENLAKAIHHILKPLN